MPQSISAPLPHAVAVPSAREHARAAKQARRTQPLEARVSALEARWEETVPTLVTSRDLSELRTELKGDIGALESRLIKWVLGAAAGVLLALAGVVSTTHSRFDSVNERIDSVNERIDSVNERIDSAVSELRTELRAEIREINARMEARFERLDSKFDALMSELRSQRNDSR